MSCLVSGEEGERREERAQQRQQRQQDDDHSHGLRLRAHRQAPQRGPRTRGGLTEGQEEQCQYKTRSSSRVRSVDCRDEDEKTRTPGARGGRRGRLTRTRRLVHRRGRGDGPGVVAEPGGPAARRRIPSVPPDPVSDGRGGECRSCHSCRVCRVRRRRTDPEKCPGGSTTGGGGEISGVSLSLSLSLSL